MYSLPESVDKVYSDIKVNPAMTMIPHEGGADTERSMWMLFAQYPFWEGQGPDPSV